MVMDEIGETGTQPSNDKRWVVVTSLYFGIGSVGLAFGLFVETIMRWAFLVSVVAYTLGITQFIKMLAILHVEAKTTAEATRKLAGVDDDSISRVVGWRGWSLISVAIALVGMVLGVLMHFLSNGT